MMYQCVLLSHGDTACQKARSHVQDRREIQAALHDVDLQPHLLALNVCLSLEDTACRTLRAQERRDKEAALHDGHL